MDPKLTQWQQQYQQQTPAVDVAALVAHAQRQQRKEHGLALLDVFAGLAVSLFCLIALVFLAQSWQEQVLYAGLAPIPIGFGLWAYRLRKRHWQQQALDVSHATALKRQQLYNQCRYWQVSAWGVGLLWAGLALTALIVTLGHGDVHPWAVSLAVNAVVLAFTVGRYRVVKARLPLKLKALDGIQSDADP
ncbi:hypothetical protein LJ739_10955 [Aestuariibacter halophilus]|uniref:RDD domain-containing protein n=1 Tax=Fluctibacter halophilus TaxID=226011 RepID=A0ABS8G9G6_9ALTE|nr:hypothetical protein [Aestuariibacter halophilus]MCC2616761.1 hypothetical protein [Aestuariibacter halophilus]